MSKEPGAAPILGGPRQIGTAVKLVRPVAAAGVAGTLMLGLPAHAAAPVYKPKVLTLTDAKGDGNGLNGQGFVSGVSVPTPADNAGADFQKVEYRSTGVMVKKGTRYVPRCTGFTVKVTLGGAPASQTIYRLTGTGVANDGLWWIQYSGGEADIRYGTAAEAESLSDHTVPLTTPAKVVGSTITFTVLERDVKATGEKLTAFRITAPGAHNRADLVALTVPEWDEVADYEGVYRPC